MILAIALGLAIVVIPFVGAGQLNGFWHYNKVLFFRVLIALLYSGVLFAGLAIALAALDNLFGMDVPGKRYFELWILICGIFATWFFLAGITEDLDSLETSTDYPKSLKVFAQYILSPLVLVYFLILYAYIAKIVIAWSWPQGWVSRLILGFSTTGFVSLLLLYPIRDRAENGWVRAAWRWFFVILIPLIPVLFLAVWRRISDYGITENRYVAIVFGIWLAAMVAYFIFSKIRNIKIIPGSLCAVVLAVSFGPWGMFAVSEKSQIARLEGLLTRDSILVDHKIQKAPGLVPQEDRRNISSIITYLHDIHGYSGIQPWFSENLNQDTVGARRGYRDPADVTPMMGFIYDRAVQYSDGNRIALISDRKGTLNIEGYQHLLVTQFITSTTRNRVFPNDDIAYRVDEKLDTMTFVATMEGDRKDSLQISLRQLVDSLMKEYGNATTDKIPPEKMSLSMEENDVKIKVYLRQAQIKREDGEIKPLSFEVVILYSINRKIE